MRALSNPPQYTFRRLLLELLLEVIGSKYTEITPQARVGFQPGTFDLPTASHSMAEHAFPKAVPDAVSHRFHEVNWNAGDIGAFERGRPKLAIQQVGSSAVLSWPSYHGEFSLQSSTNITSSKSWLLAPGSAAVVGNQYQQTKSPISGDQFFRLRGN